MWGKSFLKLFKQYAYGHEHRALKFCIIKIYTKKKSKKLELNVIFVTNT